ncbi:unnamed protein product [Phytophthora lilii]|uniref:Unnamed protein product n=1 Tax=Phytophthora lilii TaxID=2077276 RepID=A0A9W6TEM1_9STRA|nr:unnamed protein product [Phytophthora lilii]
MGLGSVTLLEINQVPNGKRIAYCLPSGEFIFVADTCAPEFGADDAADLYGGNLFQFLTLGDAEKLEDFLRAQQRGNGSALAFNPSQQMRMVVRLLNNPSTQLWIQLSTIPLTLRMMRCIDTIRSLANPLGHFADSSSFVLSEDEFTSMMRNPPDSTGSSLASGIASLSVTPSPIEDDDDLMFLEFENSCLSPTSFTSIVPLELKHRHPNFAMTHSGLGLENTETDSVSDDEEDLKASLSNLAFEADWSNEGVQNASAHDLFPAEPTAPTSSPPGPMTSRSGFRAELPTVSKLTLAFPEANMSSAAKIEVPSNDIRFQMELEFIQCLASPAYLNCACVSPACPPPRPTDALCARCSPGHQPVLREPVLHELPAVPQVLEPAAVRQVHCVPALLGLPGHAGRRAVPADDRARGLHDVGARPAVLPLADVPQQPLGGETGRRSTHSRDARSYSSSRDELDSPNDGENRPIYTHFMDTSAAGDTQNKCMTDSRES